MPEDASLDQFASSEPTDSEDAEADSEDTGAETADDADPELPDSESAEESADLSEDVDTSSVEPAVSTFAWSSDSRECADCGASAERLWRGEGQKEGGLVCADCKEW